MAQQQQQAKVLPLGDENEIRHFLDNFTKAMQSKDIEQIMSYYSSDLVAFDMMPPLRFVGKDEYRKSWEYGFDMMVGDWDFEQRDLKIYVSGELAVCHALNHARGKLKDGKSIDGWSRWSLALRKLNGNWRIVHDHNSVPIDMESEKGLFNLKP